AATSSDEIGIFSIAAATGNTLRFSMIGFTSQDVEVTSAIMAVTLQPTDRSIDEVVVVGYGTQRRSNRTGAVSTISSKETLESRPIADVGRAIQGAAPGLSVSIPSGEVGS